MSAPFDDNVVVKWQTYREWRDDEKPHRLHYAWEIRVCVVPARYAEHVRNMTPDPERAFLQVELPPEGGLPEGLMLFPFQTFRYYNACDVPLEDTEHEAEVRRAVG